MSNGDKVEDEFVQESLEGWTPRFIANGINASDLERLTDKIDTWADWCSSFSEIGDEHVELGEEAEKRGDYESVGQHYTQASMYYHFGSHVWHEDDDLRDETHQKAVEYFTEGSQYLNPPVNRIEAPYSEGGFDVPGYLTVPNSSPDGGEGDSPLVILLPGLDSTKEELHTYADDFLNRGMATLALDGAGQGETWYNHAMSPKYHKLISAVLDHVEDLDPEGVNTSRIGIMGVSLGGFYAPYTAAHDTRFDACVGISGVFSVGPVSKSSSDLMKEQFKWACKSDSLVEVDDITEQMSLRECIDDLTIPSLMITGAQDTIVYPEETERIATHAPEGEYVLFEEGNHVCNNIPYMYKPYMADWLRRQIN